MRKNLFLLMLFAGVASGNTAALSQPVQPELLYGKWCGENPNRVNLTISQKEIYLQNMETKVRMQLIVVRQIPDGEGIKFVWFVSGGAEVQNTSLHFNTDRSKLILSHVSQPDQFYIRCDLPGPRMDCTQMKSESSKATNLWLQANKVDPDSKSCESKRAQIVHVQSSIDTAVHCGVAVLEDEDKRYIDSMTGYVAKLTATLKSSCK